MTISTNSIAAPRKIAGRVFATTYAGRLSFRPSDPTEKEGTFTPGKCRIEHDAEIWANPDAFVAIVIAAGAPGVDVLFDEPDKKFDGSLGGTLSFSSASGRTKHVFVRDWRLPGAAAAPAAVKRPTRGAGPKDLGTF